MVATECVAMGADWMAGTTTRGRMMRRFRNQGGSKWADENRHQAGGQNPRTEWFTYFGTASQVPDLMVSHDYCPSLR